MKNLKKYIVVNIVTKTTSKYKIKKDDQNPFFADFVHFKGSKEECKNFIKTLKN